MLPIGLVPSMFPTERGKCQINNSFDDDCAINIRSWVLLDQECSLHVLKG